MDALDLGFGLLPVVAELLLAAHGLLRLAQFGSVPFEDAERRNDSSIGERGKTDHTQVDAYGIALGDRLFYFAFGLDGEEPFAIAAADGDIADRAKNFPAVP